MTPRKISNVVLQNDGGFQIVVSVLKGMRIHRNMNIKRLSQVSGVPVAMIVRIESGDFEAARVKDLLLIAKALGWHAGIALVPKRDKLPKESTTILKAYDRLLRSRNAVVFRQAQPDKEHPGITWDVIGDPRMNWLYIVCSNRKRRVRFAAVTDNPGGWAIGGQRFGIDLETDMIARRMSKRLLRKHRAELIQSAT